MIPSVRAKHNTIFATASIVRKTYHFTRNHGGDTLSQNVRVIDGHVILGIDTSRQIPDIIQNCRINRQWMNA